MYKARKINTAVYDAAKEKWKRIAKPLGSMGIFEDIISHIAAIQGMLDIDIKKRCALVMCADNGVVAEGVTQTDSSVTARVAENITAGKASVCLAAKAAGAEVVAVDVGIAGKCTGPINKKIAFGTRNMLHEPAMTRAQAEAAINTGMSLAKEYASRGYKLLVAGEMGIGNTTTSSAVVSVLLGKRAAEVTGRGAGLSSEGLMRKTEVIEASIALHKPDSADAVDVLRKVGGFDIAAMAGIFIGGAVYGIPVVIDGFISSAAALCACRLCEGARDYMIASHVSREKSSALILGSLGKKAPVAAEMFPGEGAGGVMLLPLLDAAKEIFCEMPEFEETGIERYRELC